MNLSNLARWLMLITYMALVSFSEIQGSSDAPDRSSRVLGGFDASIEDYPFMASIRYARSHVCGGTIISPDIVLTAAQCIREYYYLDLLYVKVGDSGIDHKGSWHQVAKVVKHDEYEQLLLQEGDSVANQNVNDIALLKLVKPIEIDNQKTRTIKLFGKSDEVHYHGSGILSGWGIHRKIEKKSSPNPKRKGTIRKVVVDKYAKNLEIVQLDIGSAHKCSDLHPSADLNGQFCTYTFGRVPCVGDFGSPLVVDGKVAGLASWTSGKCNGDSNVAYFTDVAKFDEWVKETMRKL
ncbi:hypothetical protein QAD02_010067 [Eretmocerus hayati]|uniref:Uncharacterized protein n=1 Tax=Eretmocerus hayati TaxID=131215 RepID=A0ACC2NDH5_9HYME|nr:hypothetical protein QAD02_010067 [Eretmocerus hayati]